MLKAARLPWLGVVLTGVTCATVSWGQSSSAPAYTVPPAGQATPRPVHPGAVQPSPTPLGLSDSDPEGAAGLLSDLERVVQAEESEGWVIDRSAFDALYPALMDSVCRTTDAARAQALRQVRAAAARAGDPQRLFEASGRQSTTAFEAALTAARRREALERALAGKADCPFWVVRERAFLGRQTDRHRFTLNVETGGNIQVRQTAGSWTMGGGGLGRILPAYGFTEHWTGLTGIEFGGGAMLRPGSPETEFVVNYFPALPLVLRYRNIDWHYDIETGPVAIFQADNTRLSYGVRIGGAIGVFSLRTLSVLPWAGFAMTYEHYFENSARPAAHFVRGGLRVGIVWDP